MYLPASSILEHASGHMYTEETILVPGAEISADIIPPCAELMLIPARNVRVNLEPIRAMPNMRALRVTTEASLEAELSAADHITEDLPVCLSPIISSL